MIYSVDESGIAELGFVEDVLKRVVSKMMMLSHPPMTIALEGKEALERLTKVIDDMQKQEEVANAPE